MMNLMENILIVEKVQMIKMMKKKKMKMMNKKIKNQTLKIINKRRKNVKKSIRINRKNSKLFSTFQVNIKILIKH